MQEEILNTKPFEFIDFLMKQPNVYIDKMINDIGFPSQCEKFLIMRCKKYYSFDEVEKELRITKKQQLKRVNIIKERIDNYIKGYFLDLKR